MPCKWKCASSLIRSLFGRSGFSVNIPTKWQQNRKIISLSRLLKACITCNLYGWRLRSIRRMRRTLLSDMLKVWACLRADLIGLRLTDASTRALLSGVQTEDGRPGGFLHVTAPSSSHCLTHCRIAFWDGTSCWFCSRRNPRWASVIDPVRLNSSTAHTCSLPRQRFKLTKYEGHGLCSNTCTPRYPSGETRKWNLKSFTISAALCITSVLHNLLRGVWTVYLRI